MTMVDLLCYIRAQLIDARADNNEERLTELFRVLLFLDDTCSALNDGTYLSIIEDLIDAIRHTGIAEFKVSIPSEEEIRSLGQSSH